MKDFTSRIAVEPAFQPEFFFSRVQTVGGIQYHVSVADKIGRGYYFNMASADDAWRILSTLQVPNWILTIETKLSDVIVQNDPK